MSEENANAGNGNGTAEGQGNANGNSASNANAAGGGATLTQADIQKALDAQHLRHLKATSALESQIAELKKSSKGEGKGSDLTALTDKMTSLENELISERAERSRAQVEAIAAELNAVNGSQVAMLAAPYLKMIDGKFTVVNAEGQTRINAAGQPMSVKEYIGEFLTGNPHLVKASGATGAGSQGARFGADSAGKPLTVDSIRNMPIEDLKKEMAKGIVIPGSAGQEFRFKDNKNAFAKTS